jgi:adenosine/AMP kinase
MLNLHAVKLTIPEGANIILGQSHFIKTVEDIYEAMVNTVPGAKFGVAFNEASGPCLTRSDGTDEEMRSAAIEIATAVGAGHFFAIAMRDSFPINVLRTIQMTPEVCTIFCATANPVEVIVAETEQGRGVLGVVDGSSPKGIEGEEHVRARRDFLRKIGYKR